MLFTSLTKHLLVLATAITTTFAVEVQYLVHYRSPAGAVLRYDRTGLLEDRYVSSVVNNMVSWSHGQFQGRILNEREGGGVAVVYVYVANNLHQAEGISMAMEMLVAQRTRSH